MVAFDGVNEHNAVALDRWSHAANFSGPWLGRKDEIEFPPHSPDLTIFNVSVSPKNLVYHWKSTSLAEICEEIAMACAAIPIATWNSVA